MNVAKKLRAAGPMKRVAAGALPLVIALGVAACGGSSADSSDGGGGGTVDLVAYSTPQTLYEEGIEAAYQETSEGSGVEFSNSFGSSGDQSRAVESGLPADLVHLPLEPDMQRLVDAGILPDVGENVQNSVVVFLVRGGNPEGIEDWDDLVTGEVEVITPNPFTSGGARWNIMAAYGQVLENGGTEEEGLAYVGSLLENTPVQDKSASEALTTFTGGKGDVLLAYENEAIRAIDAGEDVEYIVPDDTILIETLAQVSDEADDPDAAQAFLDYLLSENGQKEFAEGGYRPSDEKVLAEYEEEFPTPPGLFTIEDFGGWPTVATEFFDPASGSVAEIERNLGVATE
jgi:sulfate/thiosulfate transport system substrate-binding protein